MKIQSLLRYPAGGGNLVQTKPKTTRKCFRLTNVAVVSSRARPSSGDGCLTPPPPSILAFRSALIRSHILARDGPVALQAAAIFVKPSRSLRVSRSQTQQLAGPPKSHIQSHCSLVQSKVIGCTSKIRFSFSVAFCVSMQLVLVCQQVGCDRAGMARDTRRLAVYPDPKSFISGGVRMQHP